MGEQVTNQADPGNKEPKKDIHYFNKVNEERKHLEGLLKDRINFHLLFASVFMAGLATMDNPRVRVGALIVISVISAAIAVAVWRTHQLVQQALDELKEDDSHPYKRYSKNAKIPWNANSILMWVPVLLTASFAIAALFYLSGGKSGPDDDKKTIIYQINDHSDRQVESVPAPAEKQKSGGRNRGDAGKKKSSSAVSWPDCRLHTMLRTVARLHPISHPCTTC